MLGLVLGGGAAKGYAHIGAVRVLEEEGIKPDIVVGASIGALIGGFYAAGYNSKEMARIARRIDKGKKKWLFQPHLSKKGFVNGKNIIKYLMPYLGGKKIEELPVRYASVSSDIKTHTEVIINKGDLIQAIRAAISIPVVFTPHNYAGRILVDGGFVNPLPIDIAQKLGAKKIIAINVLRKVDYKPYEIFLGQPTNKTYNINIKKIFMEIFDYITSRLIDYEVRQLKDGILININTEGIGMNQFERAEPAIELGYQEVQKHREQLLTLLH